MWFLHTTYPEFIHLNMKITTYKLSKSAGGASIMSRSSWYYKKQQLYLYYNKIQSRIEGATSFFTLGNLAMTLFMSGTTWLKLYNYNLNLWIFS